MRGTLRAWLILPALAASASVAWAHGGGLDAHGCHHNRIEGGYHCHQGPLAGHEFVNATAARLAEWLVARLAASPADTARLGEGTRAQVVDGDTLDIGGHRVRLHGIDAPEIAQTCTADRRRYHCGVRARQVLIRLIHERGGPVCDVGDFDSYGRYLGVCRDAQGRDLNAAMVEAGWALAYRQYSEAYVAQEARARKAKAGMWAGQFTPPWEWRHRG